jgi:hypothetical protein
MKEIVITFFVNHQYFGSSLTGKIGSIACFGACVEMRGWQKCQSFKHRSAFSTNGINKLYPNKMKAPY